MAGLNYAKVYVLFSSWRNDVLDTYLTWEEARSHFESCEHQDCLRIVEIPFHRINYIMSCLLRAYLRDEFKDVTDRGTNND